MAAHMEKNQEHLYMQLSPYSFTPTPLPAPPPNVAIVCVWGGGGVATPCNKKYKLYIHHS